MSTEDGRYEAATQFVGWLEDRVLRDARGDDLTELTQKPADRLWLGRLAAQNADWKQALGERGQRLDPCASGFRFQPAGSAPWQWSASVGCRIWSAVGETRKERVWKKGDLISVQVPIEVSSADPGTHDFGEDVFSEAFANAGHDSLVVRIQATVERESNGRPSVALVVVNDSPEGSADADTNLYEVTLTVEVGDIEPFVLDSLPDSFRYDRRVDAYGVNCSVLREGKRLVGDDRALTDRRRPTYWDDDVATEPDLRFARLATDPIPPLRELVAALRSWGEREWSIDRLEQRAIEEGWSAEMKRHAFDEAGAFSDEVRRCELGVEAMDNDSDVRTAFEIMNEAMAHSGQGHYERWRPFQLGFLIASLPSLVSSTDPDRNVVDTLWFATGGGKTETYLGVIVMCAVLDRLRGKHYGVTAWSRFPLRMLSLQQTQRFADALAGAELARRRHGLGGEPFSLGFLVGAGGTPNRVRDEPEDADADANDLEMPKRYLVLLHCPFCRSTDLEMEFDRRYWRLTHTCGNEDCPWTDGALPFFVVDEEIYRFLPTVVVGTLDKAASISMQRSMRGLYASPISFCSRPGHGFGYAPRKTGAPKGCLVPGCEATPAALPQGVELFAPSLRIQDELHLLRDSLGAVDSHYETLLDHLYRRTGSPLAKIIASSATLSGHAEQVAELYVREGRAFPHPGPREGASFWTKEQPHLARRFVGLAPRGVTLEFANERIAESLQRAVRRLSDDPDDVCQEAGVDPVQAPFLLSYYGTQVVYGTRIRDVEAAARSFETQPAVEPLNFETLTGGTPLSDVQAVLARLTRPEEDFLERIHLVCASSMMSHGVDVERFNVITLLGLPLATAEFIQTTARIGRTWPGLVFVLHRMGVERDASVFRSFPVYVRHGDRFVEPVAITRRSRRVLDRTFAGLFDARVFGIHEAKRLRKGGASISWAPELRKYAAEAPLNEDEEFQELCDALQIDPDSEDSVVADLRSLVRRTFAKMLDPASRATFIGDVTPSKPMRSLREVESQVPIRDRESGRG